MSSVVAIYDRATAPSRSAIREHLDAMEYRGADACEILTTGPVGVGCQLFRTRPASSGHPVARAGDTAVALDGRIDAWGACGNVESEPAPDEGDAASFAHYYNYVGTDVFDSVSGEFVVIVWDGAARRLIAGRDKTGVRQLYYTRVGDRTVLASDVTALSRAADSPPSINEGLLAEWLVGNVATTDETFYEGIMRLEPGCYLDVRPSGKECRRYWTPWELPNLDIDLDAAAQQLNGLLRTAVVDRLDGHSVPTVLMSGGLDSTAVTALAADHLEERSSDPPRTYSIVFDATPGIDERSGVHKMDEAYDIDARQISGDTRWPLDDLTPYEFVLHRHPCIDTSITMADIATSSVSEQVLLTGIGGNLQDGDHTHYTDLLRSGRVGAFVRRSLGDDGSLLGRLLVHGLGKTLMDDWTFLNEIHGRVTKPPWPAPLSAEFAHRVDLSDRLAHRRQTDRFDEVGHKSLYFKLTDPSLAFALSGVRQLYLHRGIERRHPLLDSRIVEFLFSIPSDHLVSGGEMKALFRRATEDVLPTGVLSIPTSENAYSAFLERGFSRESGLVRDLLSSARLAERGYVSQAALWEMWDDYQRGVAGNHDTLWRVIGAELWLQTVDGNC